MQITFTLVHLTWNSMFPNISTNYDVAWYGSTNIRLDVIVIYSHLLSISIPFLLEIYLGYNSAIENARRLISA